MKILSPKNAILFLFPSVSLFGQTLHVWNVNGSGLWNVDGNWNPSGFPNSANDGAQFNQLAAPAITVTLGQDVSVSEILFSASGGGSTSYTIAGGNSISMVPSAMNDPFIQVASATDQTIANSSLVNNSSNSLTLSNGANTGVLTISSNFTSPSLAGLNIVVDNPNPGKTVLTGTNDFGFVFVEEGATLSIASPSNLGTTSVILGVSATLEITASMTISAGFSLDDGASATNGIIDVNGALTTATFTGAIHPFGSGLRGITKEGAGVLVLSNNGNTYTRGTTVNAGTLRAGVANAMPATGIVSLAGANTVFDLNNLNQQIGNLSGVATSSVTLGSATLSLTDNSNQTFAGVISGSGNLVKTGSGTLTLTQANTYTGATEIFGTLSAGTQDAVASSNLLFLAGTFDLNTFDQSIGSLSGTSGAQIQMGANDLAIHQNLDASFAGTISGSGGLTKQGPSLLILSGNNNYTGATLVSEGQLAVNGQIASDTTIDSGALLGGTGTVQGHVEALGGGFVHPGNSIGTLTVDTITFNSNSIYSLEINPAASSSILVTGPDPVGMNAAIVQPGAILNLIATGGDYEAGKSYLILETTTGTILDGTAFQTQNPTPEFDFTLFQDPTNQFLYLILNTSVPVLLPTAGLTGNRLVIANYLNSLRNYAPLEPVFDELALHFGFETIQTNAAYERALDLISPARNAFSTFASQMIAFALNDIVDSRLSNRRMIQSPNPNNGNELALVCQSDESPLLTQAGGRQKRYSAWGAPFGQFAREKAQDQTPEFHFNAGGVLAGFDVFDFENFIVGSALGYAYVHLVEDDDFGKIWMNDYAASLYGSFFTSDFYLNGSIWGGFHEIRNRRNIFFQGFNGAARSKTHGWQWVPHIDFGYDYFFSYMAIEPFARFDWAVNFEKGFTERGAEPLDMTQNGHTSSMLRSEAGLAVYQILRFDNRGLFTARESLSYVNQTPFGNSGNVTAAIVGAPGGPFTVETLTATQNLFDFGFELFYRSPGAIFASFSYDGEFGSNYWSNTVILKAGQEF